MLLYFLLGLFFLGVLTIVLIMKVWGAAIMESLSYYWLLGLTVFCAVMAYRGWAYLSTRHRLEDD